MLTDTELEDYPEVVGSFLSPLPGRGGRPETEVHLDLSDVWDEGDDFSNQPAELADGSAQAPGLHAGFRRPQRNEPDVRRAPLVAEPAS